MLMQKKEPIAALLALSLALGTILAGCGHGSSAATNQSDQADQTKQTKQTEQTEQTDHQEEQNISPTENTEIQPESEKETDILPAAIQDQKFQAKDKNNTAAADTPDSQIQENDSYFNDAVFIGDSLTEGFQLHGGLTGATYYGFKNLNVKDVFEKPLVKNGQEKITVADALKKNVFGKYYIMLGANELGWVYPEVFTKKYGQLIDLIREVNPDAIIYLQSVLPVSAEASATNKYYSNDRINYYDELISALAVEKNATYLNVREAVENDSGILPDEAATDGVHLNKDYCLKWADYLRSHK